MITDYNTLMRKSNKETWEVDNNLSNSCKRVALYASLRKQKYRNSH